MRPVPILILFLAAVSTILLGACGPVSPMPVPTPTVIPTFTPTLAPTLTPTKTFTPTEQPCSETFASADTSSEDATLQGMLAYSGISGTVQTSSIGEKFGLDCSYHEMSFSAAITVDVPDINDQLALAYLAGQVEEILLLAPLYRHPSFSDQNATLTFRGSDGRECRWYPETHDCR